LLLLELVPDAVGGLAGLARLANASRAAFMAGVSVRTWSARLTFSLRMLDPLELLMVGRGLGVGVVDSSIVGGKLDGGGRVVIVSNRL
jgi:hypothetical protein